MAAHMNASTAAQETQSIALAQLVENTHQREFDKMFNTIPIYDGKDPDKFEPWLEQLQNACRVGKHDIWEVAMCCTSRPVLEVLQSMDPVLGWSKICDELQRCFSPNRTSAHAAALLTAFRKQNKNENLKSSIYQYMKLHAQATGVLAKDDYDLMRKVKFLKRLHNKFIGNKIIRSNAFKSYMTFLMADCFSKVLELEGEYQVGKVVSPGMDLHIMSGIGQLTGEEVQETNTSGDAETEQKAPAYNQNPCYNCKEIRHFKRDCPLLNQPMPIIAGKSHHTLDVGKEMLDDFLSKLLQAEWRGVKLYAKQQKERQQNMEKRYNQGGSRTYGGSRAQPATSNTPSTNTPPKKTVRFMKGPSSATPVQTRLHNWGAMQAGTQSKTAVQQPMKPIIKTNSDVSTTMREVQSEDEEPYMEDDLEDLANLPTDSEPEDLSDIDSEDYDDIDPKQ